MVHETAAGGEPKCRDPASCVVVSVGVRTSSRIVETNSLEDHARLIREQVDKSLKDPQTRWLAAALASGNYVWVKDPRTGEQVPAVRYHDRAYRVHPGQPVCGPRDFSCEVVSIWNFLVLNTKYTADADGYDTYQDLRTTLETGASDCFALDTPVIVRARATGCYEIRTLQELRNTWPAYDALTYDFANTRWAFEPITAWQSKGVQEVVASSLSNGPAFRHTPNHRVWWYDGQAEYKRVVERELGIEVSVRQDLRRVLVARQIPALGAADLTRDQAYLAGIYAAEGYVSGYKMAIAQDRKDITARIDAALAASGATYRYVDRGRHNYFYVNARDTADGGLLRRWLHTQGSNSFDMQMHADVLGGSAEVVRTALEAHGDGDAYRPKPGSTWFDKVSAVHVTSSPRLAQQLQLMCMILGEPWNTQLQAHHGGSGTSPIYRVHRWLPEGRAGRRHVPELPGVGHSTIRNMLPAGDTEVADITVNRTHNFVLSNGMIVHNCDDSTIAFCALLRAIGFKCNARIISQDGQYWAHVYPMVMIPGRGYTALDITESGKSPGWEFPHARAVRDFPMGDG